MTDRERATEVFFSQIRQRYELPDGLVSLWFETALADFELDVRPLGYDPATEMFAEPDDAAAVTIGLIMSLYCVRRERSRISKLNNIIGRDIQLNATGEAKRAVQQEHDDIAREIAQRLHKQKQNCF